MATVNRSARPCRETAQDVLNSLPVAVFRYDVSSCELTAVNAAASNLAAAPIMAELAAAVGSWDATNDGGTSNKFIGHRAERYLVRFPADHDSSDNARTIAAIPWNESEDPTLGGDLSDDAFHDPLTRLPNRRLFQQRLERAIQRAAKSQYQFALLFVDLDRFKSVNSRFGHVVGDKMLVAAAQRLLKSVRPHDTVARRDGDEFTVLLDDLANPTAAESVAERICQQMREPLQVEGQTAEIGASVGIVTSAAGEQSAEALIAAADAAMYHAKALGGGTFVSLPKTLPR